LLPELLQKDLNGSGIWLAKKEIRAEAANLYILVPEKGDQVDTGPRRASFESADKIGALLRGRPLAPEDRLENTFSGSE